MRIHKENCPALFNEYDLHKALKSGTISIQRLANAQLDTFRGKVPDVIKGFCEYNGLEQASEQERLEAFVKFNQRAFSKFLNAFNVEMASDSFYDSLDNCSIEKVLEKGDLYDILGECGGIIHCPGEGIVEYAIMKEGSLLRFVPDALERAYFVYDFGGIDSEWLNADKYDRYYYEKAITILILKKYGEVQSVMVAKDTIRTIGEEKVVNKAPFSIRRLDSSFFKTIIRTGVVMVKSHLRLQACGHRWKDHRLIMVRGHERVLSNKTAPAIKARAVA